MSVGLLAAVNQKVLLFFLKRNQLFPLFFEDYENLNHASIFFRLTRNNTFLFKSRMLIFSLFLTFSRNLSARDF